MNSDDAAGADDRLREIVEVWPGLSEAARENLVGIVRALATIDRAHDVGPCE